jgi:protein O-GlcNAc transferase
VSDFVPRLKLLGDGPGDRTGLAQKLLDRGMEEEALVELGSALRANPELAEAHQLIGRVFLQREEHEEALVHLDRAVRLDPHLAEAWVMKALAHYRLEAFELALHAADEAIESDDEMERAYILKGEILRDLERSREAIACFEKVIELSPDDLASHRRLAELYSNEGRKAAARRHRMIVRKLNWVSGTIDMEVGDLYSSDGDGIQALEFYRRAAESCPWDSEHLRKMGAAYRENHLGGASLNALAGALRRDPKDADSYVEVARVLADEGRNAEAIAVLRAAVTVDPEASEATELLREWIVGPGTMPAGHRQDAFRSGSANSAGSASGVSSDGSLADGEES